MAKLPIHPLILVPVYVLLVCLATVPLVYGQIYSPPLVVIGVTGALALQTAWAVQALVFVCRMHPLDRAPGRKNSLTAIAALLLTLLICLCVVASYNGYLKSHLSSASSMAILLKTASSICEGLAVVLFFSVFWISAAGVCSAEAGKKVPPHRIVGTFLELIYIAIGAPFLFARLKRMQHGQWGAK